MAEGTPSKNTPIPPHWKLPDLPDTKEVSRRVDVDQGYLALRTREKPHGNITDSLPFDFEFLFGDKGSLLAERRVYSAGVVIEPNSDDNIQVSFNWAEEEDVPDHSYQVSLEFNAFEYPDGGHVASADYAEEGPGSLSLIELPAEGFIFSKNGAFIRSPVVDFIPKYSADNKIEALLPNFEDFRNRNSDPDFPNQVFSIEELPEEENTWLVTGQNNYYLRTKVLNGSVVIEQELIEGRDLETTGVVKKIRLPGKINYQAAKDTIMAQTTFDPETGQINAPWQNILPVIGAAGISFAGPSQELIAELEQKPKKFGWQ